MMDRHSNFTLDSIARNDSSCTELWIGYQHTFGSFTSSDNNDFSALGTAIGNNTHLTYLHIAPCPGLDVTNGEFFDALRRNNSIHELCISGGYGITYGVSNKILRLYQEKGNITYLSIQSTRLDGGGHRFLTTLLRDVTILEKVALETCGITDEKLLPIVDALRGRATLEELSFRSNRIGNTGCEALATLLADPNCNLRDINLYNNDFDQSVEDIFLRSLCNKTSISDTYSSNHTLYQLLFLRWGDSNQLADLLNLNKNTNKSHVAIQKILLSHPNIDVEPLFEWDVPHEEGEGERSLKALPHVIDWFGRAEEVACMVNITEHKWNTMRLSSIYQFALAMPLLFEGIKSYNSKNNKRMRS